MTRELREFVEGHSRLFVLTGAGCSTASGIPDYRDADGEWKRSQPVLLQDFLAHEHWRKRYWARSFIGWRRMQAARPNGAHHALAALAEHGRLERLVTQNVDGLHQAAGLGNVIDLHGRVDVVRCMSCARRVPREQIQAELTGRNPAFSSFTGPAAPDGDADLDGIPLRGLPRVVPRRGLPRVVDFASFEIPSCTACGGLLKPDVVFFGERVPAERVQAAFAALDRADAMLVVGSSLMVYSGYRFAKAAADAGKPIAAVNLGRTRADELLALKVSAPCSEALAFLLGERPGTPAAAWRTATP
jgi:NAD-dependent SIR2 family protein deacetylase